MPNVVREYGPTLAAFLVTLLSAFVFYTQNDLWLALSLAGVALAIVGGSLVCRVREERAEARRQMALDR